MSAQSVLFDNPGPRGRRIALIGNILGVLALIGLGVFLYLTLLHADGNPPRPERFPQGQFTANLWERALGSDAWLNYYLPGLQNTLVAAGYAIIAALVFGMVLGVGRLSSFAPVRWLCGLIVEFFRAVPVLIMMIAGAAIGYAVGLDRTIVALVAVVVALTLYNGSVIAELVRSGVSNLPKGQREAGLAVGMTRGQSIRIVELPQALVAMLPSLVSQFVVVLKDSALGQIILYSELLRNAKLVGTGAPFAILQSLTVAAVIFIILNTALGFLAQFVAKRVGGRVAGKTRPDAAPAAVAVGAGAVGADLGSADDRDGSS